MKRFDRLADSPTFEEFNPDDIMYYRLFSAALALTLMFSCGSPEPKKSANEVSTPSPKAQEHDHDHDGHSHDGPTLLPVPDGARVFFTTPSDGATVQNPVILGFGVEGMEVEPAGEPNEGKGHHHVLINEAVINEGEVVPANATNIHYGGGQVGDTLDLPAGTHTLTMQFADGLHRSYGEQMSATITVTVTE